MDILRFSSFSEISGRLTQSRSRRRRRTSSTNKADSGEDLRFTWVPPALLTLGVAAILLATYSYGIRLWVKMSFDWDSLLAACLVVLGTFFVSMLLKDPLLWIPRDEAANVFGWEGREGREHAE